MEKILFVCHGNICRSQMAQSIAFYLAKKAGKEDEFYFDSAATSTEEIGNTMYPPAVRKLNKENIPVVKHRARQITKNDIDAFDKIYYMDRNNENNLKRMFRGLFDEKFERLLIDRDISDPWYTDDFDSCFDDIVEGLHDKLGI